MRVIDGIKTKIFPVVCGILIADGGAFFYAFGCKFASADESKRSFSICVNVISDGSPSRMRIVLRISLGMTTLPRSSIRLTIPVAFIYENLLFRCITELLFAIRGFLCKDNFGNV